MDEEKLARADALEAEAERLRDEAFSERPLPNYWRVGQKVRYIKKQEFGFVLGAIATIIKVRDPDIPAAEYNVFWTTNDGAHGRYWTTPDEVELVEDYASLSTASKQEAR